MDPEDIKAIISVQLEDQGLDVSMDILNAAVQYYQQHQRLPELSEIYDIEMQNMAELFTNDQSENINSISRINHYGILQISNVPISNQHVPGVNPSEHIFPNRYQILGIALSSLLNFPVSNLINESDVMNLLNPQNDVKKVITDVNKIPLIMIKDPSEIKHNTECLICYDPFVETDIVRVLPCKHQIHRRCIDNYLQEESHICPFCKESAGEYRFLNHT